MTSLRLLLVRHPGTSATGAPVMPGDEPAVGGVPDLTQWLGRRGRIVTSPARRCAVPGAPVEPRLRPWNLGSWTGQPWQNLDLAAWRSDPSYDGHGGESLTTLLTRASALLADWHTKTGRLAAVTHGPVIKAAVVHALQAPAEALWQLDVAPSSRTELHATEAGWRVTHVACR